MLAVDSIIKENISVSLYLSTRIKKKIIMKYKPVGKRYCRL